MFISTREMLEQLGRRRSDQTAVEKHLSVANAKHLAADSALESVIEALGPEALSEQGLRMLAVRLEEQNRQSRPAVAETVFEMASVAVPER